MEFKSANTLRTSLVTRYSNALDIDLTEGTPERDIFVEAPIEAQLIDLWNGLEYLYKLQAPFLYQDELLEEDLDSFCRNEGVGSISATYSSGKLLFYTYNTPTSNITIDTRHGGKHKLPHF